jgi:hypothetical protein
MTDRFLNARNTNVRQRRCRRGLFFFTPTGDENSTQRTCSLHLAPNLDESALVRSRWAGFLPDRRMTTAFLVCILVVVTLLARGPVRAQAQPPQVQVFEIMLREDPIVKPGRVGAVEGVTDHKGHHFLVQNLDILQPVAVALVAREPALPMKLQLMKHNPVKLPFMKHDWNQPDRSGVTDAKGVATFRVRTQGDMKIRVTSETPQGGPYSLVVWAGDEMQLDMGNVLMPMQKSQQRQSGVPRDAGSWSTSMIVIVVLLGLIAFALIGVLWRLGPRGRTMG